MATRASLARQKTGAACLAVLTASPSVVAAKPWKRWVGVSVILASAFAVGVSAGPPYRYEPEKFTCRPKKGILSQWVSLLYQVQHNITFACEEATPVPTTLISEEHGLMVCAESMTPEECEANPAPLSAFLPGATKEWVTGDSVLTGLKISVPESQYPANAKSFRVGCRHNTKTGNTCMLTIHVEPRDPAVERQEARCSYTENSTLPKIFVTKDSNTMTLACGPHGAPMPESYTENYCSTPDTCDEKPFTSVIPGYLSKWFFGDPKSPLGAMLRIPPEQIPSSPQIIYLGCTGPTDGEGPKYNCTVPVQLGGEDPSEGSRPGGGSGGGKRGGGQGGGGGLAGSDSRQGSARHSLPSGMALSASALLAMTALAY
ncbi:SAG-related sequence SRS29C [Toxoplasma gondii ME49]|uniref:SRS29C n=2 Tax=Toxoplasma gondii TaxID=5811 RepID=B6KK34_TOXGV|nr:SAG-related sequence SRS29C [Toxoplasma gondii ME49]EPT28762.1 SAG-related sequence SRS29C [Toxoplasma gondii ME49]ESS35837.1 SAG-related sequence SRS29C [Toxoplasma gondii VEG]CEL75009.1 TPA: SRS29C [Toxoplasma gondii VEG]|eukprot:XP_002368207.1 SAG-related sequence SRS29C [Toxoplasma gondii ME49]